LDAAHILLLLNDGLSRIHPRDSQASPIDDFGGGRPSATKTASGSGEPVCVLLHYWGGAGRTWEHVIVGQFTLRASVGVP
jgi:hypothetical protein